MKKKAILQERVEQFVFPDWLLKQWRDYQCPDCKNGDRSKCSATKKNYVAFREEPDGTRHYYCFVGCLMLELNKIASKKELKKFMEAQFNDEGHYEKLARG